MDAVENVIEICMAYEQGYSAGSLSLSKDNNPHEDKSQAYYAFILGHTNSISNDLIHLNMTKPN